MIQLLAPRMLDDSTYVAFSVVWSTIYLCVAAMSGVQQEVTRAARQSAGHEPSTALRTFTVIAAGAIVVVSLLSGMIIGTRLVPIDGLVLGAALSIGLVGYLLTAVLSGVLYGLHEWRFVALLMTADAVLRVIVLVLGFVFQASAAQLAFGIAFPFGAAFLLVWAFARRRVVGSFSLDVSLRALSRNVLSTVGAAACSGAMISGLPLLIGATGGGDTTAQLAAVIMAITVTRAPIVVPILALQSFLISAVFRGRSRAGAPRILRMLAISLLVFLVLSVLGYFFGPAVISFLSAGKYEIAGLTMFLIVLSAGLVGLLGVTGSALVAERLHSWNFTGWAVAAVLTVGCLLAPLPLIVRIDVALILPPVVGLIVHITGMMRPLPRALASDRSTSP
ncbi:hypothetical protein [Microbacterium oxydans]|uniref:hypothetical protein n=1 Tax=Microbacterium oxydans TaxID=82380 RepID=UPI0012E01FD9|nr:hypothetical protein [Microbacterium oxydans]